MLLRSCCSKVMRTGKKREISNTMSDAGRTLYAVSRAAKAKPNDANRLKKYLARFALD